MKPSNATDQCSQCRGRKFVSVVYPGINRSGLQACAVCDGKGWVWTKPRKKRRIVSEGPEVD